MCMRPACSVSPEPPPPPPVLLLLVFFTGSNSIDLSLLHSDAFLQETALQEYYV